VVWEQIANQEGRNWQDGYPFCNLHALHIVLSNHTTILPPSFLCDVIGQWDVGSSEFALPKLCEFFSGFGFID